ncbi:MAG: metallophosphoesterase [Schwartzia sp.]|nr:metallophosphoesterase [Schwartzia sp. (in: firmicutes)]
MVSAVLRRPALAAFFSAISRRAFLSMSLQAAAGSVLASILAPLRSAFAGTPAVPRLFRRIVTRDNKSSAMIEWQTDAELSKPRFFWREAGNKSEKTADVDVKYFALDDHPVFVFRAALSGLPAGRKIECRVETAGKTAGTFVFQTDDGGALRSLILPDSQCDADYDAWARVSGEASARCPNAELWINMGDLVDNGASFYQWNEWQSATDASLGGRAFAPVMGNHECYSLDWKYCRPDAFLSLFATPDNGSAKYQRYYYSFDYGPVHFIVLNTQREELAALAPGLFEEQAAWLARDLKSAKARWRVALLHRDLIDYDEEPMIRDPFVETLVPVLEKGGIDAVLTAHAHAYRRRRLSAWKPAKDGVPYILTGNAGNCFYDVKKHEIDEIAFPDNFLNYMTMEADESKLTFRCFLPNGILKDFVTLRKQPKADE